MKFILGTKQEMTQYFSPEGKVFPATIVSAGPVFVTQLKTKEKDGYSAVQVGFGTRKDSRLSKALLGHLAGKSFMHIKEFRITEDMLADFSVGSEINASLFTAGENVSVSGISKGKGFQGVVKRHGFHGDKRTHGRKHSERKPGSIGGGLRTRVPKGMRMAGRMGGDVISVKNLQILASDPLTNTIFIKGALPGRRGTLLEIVSKS